MGREIWKLTGGALEDILELVRYFFSFPDVWKDAGKVGQALYDSFIKPFIRLFESGKLKPYDRGKLAGIALGTLVEFILIAKALGRAAGKIPITHFPAAVRPTVGRWVAWSEQPFTPKPVTNALNRLTERLSRRKAKTEDAISQAKKEIPAIGRKGGATEHYVRPLLEGEEYVDPNELWFSQRKAGSNEDYHVHRMTTEGWTYIKPREIVDAVQLKDHKVVLDNTRVALAQEFGFKKIPIRVHKTTDPLPAKMIESDRFGLKAETWGDALRFRTERSDLPISGTKTRPKLPSQE